MKKFIFAVALGGVFFLSSCGSDDTCVTCVYPDVAGIAVPDVEVCKAENGNATVGGTDTGLAYDSYITSQELLGDCK